MNKILQKEILKKIASDRKNLVLLDNIIDDICLNHFNLDKNNKNDYRNFSREISKQLDLLSDDGSIKKDADEHVTYFRMKEWGYKRLEGGIPKFWYWLIYKNHNLISFMAIILSLIAIIIPMFKINRCL